MQFSYPSMIKERVRNNCPVWFYSPLLYFVAFFARSYGYARKKRLV